MTPRLSTSLLVSALMRRAEAEGGFAAVLAKGEPTAGSVLVILSERNDKQRVLERLLQADGSYQWLGITGQVSDNTEEISSLVSRRRKYDPDLWVLELDIPSLERFAAEMNAAN